MSVYLYVVLKYNFESYFFFVEILKYVERDFSSNLSSLDVESISYIRKNTIKMFIFCAHYSILTIGISVRRYKAILISKIFFILRYKKNKNL